MGRRFISYKLEDGSEILFSMSETDETEGGLEEAGRIEEIREKARITFDEALENVRLSALQIRHKFHELGADEVELKFGLTATGDLGNNFFAICKVGVEANYEITLKWKKKEDTSAENQIKELQEKKRLLDALKEKK